MYYWELIVSTRRLMQAPKRETFESKVRSTCSGLLEKHRSDTNQKINGWERPKVEYLGNENGIDVLPPSLVNVTSAIVFRVLIFSCFCGWRGWTVALVVG